MKGAFFTLLIGALSISSSDACAACATKHPQQHYCDSKFAMKVTILGVDIHDSDISDTKLYKAKILENWKRGPGGGKFEFYTPSYFCGASFSVGETYVMTGTKEVTEDGREYWSHGTCEYNSAWDDMSDQQRAGFEEDYKSQCRECTVLEIRFPSDNKVEDLDNNYGKAATYWTPTNCYYNPQKTQQFVSTPGSEVEDCEDVYGLCKRNRAGECQWKMTAEYKSCFEYRDEFVIVDSGKFAITDVSQCEAYTNRRKRKKCVKKFKEKNGNDEDYIQIS